MKSNIAGLSERISFIYFPTTQNQYGDIVEGEKVTRCTVWARICPITSKTDDVIPERTNNIKYRVIIRYRKNILPDDEILWRGRRLKMLSPPYDFEGERKFLNIDCVEVIEDGKTAKALWH